MSQLRESEVCAMIKIVIYFTLAKSKRRADDWLEDLRAAAGKRTSCATLATWRRHEATNAIIWKNMSILILVASLANPSTSISTIVRGSCYYNMKEEQANTRVVEDAWMDVFVGFKDSVALCCKMQLGEIFLPIPDVTSSSLTWFLKSAASIEFGSSCPGQVISSSITLCHVYEIAKSKQTDPYNQFMKSPSPVCRTGTVQVTPSLQVDDTLYMPTFSCNLLSGRLCQFSGQHSLHRPNMIQLTGWTLIISHWKVTMDEEMNTLTERGTWTLIRTLKEVDVVGCQWIFVIMFHPDGTVDRYKVRLVAKGFTQTYVLTFLTASHLLLASTQSGFYFLSLSTKNT
ncbi:hypothetical protein KSP39_PZI014711 [Platanthera zijinensis]|uniref:Large ribosomal subunit protein uL11 C-terminal domain-containing protein n=1 Tax=Platanthera zijinensis TaxID=2320716 RepID=A0AAP0G259_9ASPA